jgi:hypothetical protein
MAWKTDPVYNIDQPVGPGKPNKPDDVRLVQALFIELSRFEANDWVLKIPAQARSLSTSGIFDETLKQWILAFQRAASEQMGGLIKVDGVIDPMREILIMESQYVGKTVVSGYFKSGRYSTFADLCNRLWGWNRAAYLRIGEDYVPLR